MLYVTSSTLQFLQNKFAQKLVHKNKTLYSQIYLKNFYKGITDEGHEYCAVWYLRPGIGIRPTRRHRSHRL